MGWFDRFCRNAGLMIHHIVRPVPTASRRETSRKVEQKKVNDTVTLRRTTIEEIEVKKSDP